ncbi:lactonase family protein [Dyadobacter jejuensis]|nr:lactonase family protein [Dyadobacter jejuensis]
MSAEAQNNTTNIKDRLYIGTYTQKGAGIYVYEFNPENYKTRQIQVLESKTSPSFLAIHPSKRFLYAANEGNNTVASYRIDPSTGELAALNAKPSGGSGPCHVSLDPKGKLLFISNYGSGSLAVYSLQNDGQVGQLIDTVQNPTLNGKKPHMHSIIPSADGRFIYASDLGNDRIYLYDVDAASGKIHPGQQPFVAVQAGDGPRHFTLHPNGQYAYSAGELNSVVNVFSVHPTTGALKAIQRISMLPKDYSEKSSAADIHISADGKFLYASNRGHESLVIYEVDGNTGLLKTLDFQNSGGKHPRNFFLDPKGEFSIITNRDTDNVVLFKRNRQSGLLQPTEWSLSIPTPVFVTQMSLD